MSKTKARNLIKKLSHFRSAQDSHGALIFTSRESQSRYVKVIMQDESSVVLPIVVESDGSERVAFHVKTAKSVVEFLSGKVMS